MHQFSDGEPIVLICRSESGEPYEVRGEYCDPPLLIDDAGNTCLHYYIYEPDGCTDMLPLGSVVELRRDPRPS